LASACGENLRQKSLKTGAIPPNGMTEIFDAEEWLMKDFKFKRYRRRTDGNDIYMYIY